MKLSKSNGKKRRFWWRNRIAVAGALVMVLLFSGTALAAQVTDGNPYILPRGEVVNDDLYVTGNQVIINGDVEGDLVVAAGYVEINGVVNGDVLAAGGAVVIAGAVQDDVKIRNGVKTCRAFVRARIPLSRRSSRTPFANSSRSTRQESRLPS